MPPTKVDFFVSYSGMPAALNPPICSHESLIALEARIVTRDARGSIFLREVSQLMAVAYPTQSPLSFA